MRVGFVLAFAIVLVAWAPSVAGTAPLPSPTHMPATGSSTCVGCDLLGYSNIQGGYCDANGTCHSNLDIGAGSTDNPGAVVLNYDVGRDVFIYDGQKTLLASFGPKGIAFYRTPKIKHPLPPGP